MGTGTGQAPVECPSCGERYASAEDARRILDNWGYCVNVTCLEDLAALPIERLMTPKGGEVLQARA